jgi:hypothetical protein
VPTATPRPTVTPTTLLSMATFLGAPHSAGTASAMAAAMAAANASALAPFELATSLYPAMTYCQTGDPKLRGIVSFVEDRRTECQVLMVEVWQAYLSLETQQWLGAVTAAYAYASSQPLGVPEPVQPANSVELWKAHLDDYLLQLFP